MEIISARKDIEIGMKGENMKEPKKYIIEYGDGDEEEFYVLDEQQKFLFAYALATEHYWFYDRNEISEMFDKETIKVIEKD